MVMDLEVQVQGHDINTWQIQALFSCQTCFLSLLQRTTPGLVATLSAAFPQTVGSAG